MRKGLFVSVTRPYDTLRPFLKDRDADDIRMIFDFCFHSFQNADIDDVCVVVAFDCFVQHLQGMGSQFLEESCIFLGFWRRNGTDWMEVTVND